MRNIKWQPPFWYQDIFVKVSYVVAGLFLANCGYICHKGNNTGLFCLFVFSWHSRNSSHSRFSSFPVTLATPSTVFLQGFFFKHSPSTVFISLVRPVVFNVVGYFFRCLEWSLKVGFLCSFSLKRKCFLWLKCSSCMISICYLGFWSKGWSFVGFLLKREDLYMVWRFRVLRKTFICMIFVNSCDVWIFLFDGLCCVVIFEVVCPYEWIGCLKLLTSDLMAKTKLRCPLIT